MSQRCTDHCFISKRCSHVKHTSSFKWHVSKKGYRKAKGSVRNGIKKLRVSCVSRITELWLLCALWILQRKQLSQLSINVVWISLQWHLDYLCKEYHFHKQSFWKSFKQSWKHSTSCSSDCSFIVFKLYWFKFLTDLVAYEVCHFVRSGIWNTLIYTFFELYLY